MDSVFLITLPCLMILLAPIRASSDSANCFGEYCFTYSGSGVTRSFADARSWCTNNTSSSLAAVSNKSSQDALYALLSSSQISSSIYVNAKANQTSDSTWYTISGVNFLGEVKDQSLDRNNKYQFYTFLKIWSEQTFAIFPSSPQESMNYICSYRSYAGNFPPNTNYSYNGSVYIKYENEILNWFEARNRCYLNGGDLATFLDLSNFNTRWLNSSFSYWIGIRWTNWRWQNMDDNQEIIYTRWSNGRPNNYNSKCVCIGETSSHNWTDCDCTTTRSIVCSKYIGTSTVTSPSTTLNTQSSLEREMSLSQNTEKSNTLAIGVGVGVGGGVLIILVIVVIFIVVKKRNSRQGRSEVKPHKGPKESKKSTETPVKQPTANTGEYAEILAASQPGPRGSVKKPVVYTTPEFVEIGL